MKEITVVALVLLLVAGVACAERFASTKRAGIYQVTLKMADAPLAVGDNKATIAVRDAAGPVAGAEVWLYYFMPSMPSMNYETMAAFRENAYEAAIKPTMRGDWTVEVRVHGADGTTYKALFDFKAK
jgi:YtkA-like